MVPETTSSRRRFLQWTGAAAVSLSWISRPVSAAKRGESSRKHSPGKGLKLGVTSYSFRGVDLDHALAMTKRVGLKHISLKSVHLPLDASPEQIAATAAKVRQAGLDFYGVGVVNMQKPAEVSQAFDYAKAAGVRVIIAAPTAEMLPLVDEKVKQYDLQVAIHNHGPTDKHFPTPESVYRKIEALDRRIGLCIDIGHTVRVGADLIRSVEKYGDRLLDIHMKDVTEASPKGKEIQVGRGIIDIPGFLRALVKVHYTGVVAFEYEPEPQDPVVGLAESVGYTRGVLAML
ncbi:MAG: sugar phosphate isomerase/epimerase [Planctomycetes bacterium]|nr:sugar phosphate isomerase/epimerase [Planctomycetota bacterium]